MNKELIKKLASEIEENYSPCTTENLITEWFEQNPIEPVIVGLSDEQIKDFANHYGLSITEQTKLRIELSKWLKTQTFAQPIKVVSSDDYYKLVSDYEELDKRFAKIGEDRNFFECAARSAEAQVEHLAKMYGDTLKELEQLKAQQKVIKEVIVDGVRYREV